MNQITTVHVKSPFPIKLQATPRSLLLVIPIARALSWAPGIKQASNKHAVNESAEFKGSKWPLPGYQPFMLLFLLISCIHLRRVNDESHRVALSVLHQYTDLLLKLYP